MGIKHITQTINCSNHTSYIHNLYTVNTLHHFTYFTYRYPGLWRKQATFEERKKIEAQGVISAQSTNNITLVKALEIDDVIDGLDEKVIL